MAQFTESDKDILSSVYDNLNEYLSLLHEDRKFIKNKLRQYLKEKTDSSIVKEDIDIKITKYNQKKEENKSKIDNLNSEIKKLSALIKSKTKSPKKVSTQSSNYYFNVPDEFANLVGKKKESITSLPYAVKVFWDYIKENNLLNKETKTVEINDEIRNLFNLKDDENINFINVHRYISKISKKVKAPISYSYSISSNGESTPVHYWDGDY